MFVEARQRLNPHSAAEWISVKGPYGHGVYAAFDGVGSPVTQTFGLGVLEPVTPQILDTLEAFFFERGSPVHHEVSPLAGVEAYAALVDRRYRPIELTSVMCQPLNDVGPAMGDARPIHPDSEAVLWRDINARAWAHDLPAMQQFLDDMGAVGESHTDAIRFLAFVDGVAAAAGSLNIDSGVAVFAGAATVPEMRGRGAQNALLHARLDYARTHGCDLAMMCALPGGTSQKNAERNGFRVMYTRTKWELTLKSR